MAKLPRNEEILEQTELHSSLDRCKQAATEGAAMRDIRVDLQQRADLALDRMKALDLHYMRRLELLRREVDANTAELKSALATIAKLMEFEDRRMGNRPPETIPQELDQAV